MEPGIVSNFRKCQTSEAKWLCIHELYEKVMEISGNFDIGGTYTGQKPDFWFRILTSSFQRIFIVKLFVCNRDKSPFVVGVGFDSLLQQMKNKEDKNFHMVDEHLDYHDFNHLPENTCSFLHSFTLNNKELSQLKGKDVFIAVKLSLSDSYHPSKNTMMLAKRMSRIGTLLGNHDFSDLMIESEDGFKFPSHKIIVMSQSVVLKKLLDTCGNTYKFDDMNKECVEKMLEFIYTGRVSNILNVNCVALLKAALTYDIQGLVTLSKYALQKKISLDNVFEILKLAQEHKLTDLIKPVCYNIIKDSDIILKSDKWKSFDNVEAIKMLTEFLCKKEILHHEDPPKEEKNDESEHEPLEEELENLM